MEEKFMQKKKKIRFNAFYVIMERVPVVANFKWPVYQTFD